MRAWPALLLVIALLAGCTGTEGADNVDPDGTSGADPQNPDGNTTAPPSGNGTADGQDDETADGTDQNGTGSDNTPPTAELTADTSSGTAPLNVTFAVKVADDDGDALSWTLDYGDGATEEGTEGGDFLHAYQAGNFTAVLTVSDGTDEANASVEITVEAGEVAEPDLHCHRDTASEAGTGIYIHDEGGTWIFLESNGIDGLQVANNHPTAGLDLGFDHPDWGDCVDGDLMLV